MDDATRDADISSVLGVAAWPLVARGPVVDRIVSTLSSASTLAVVLHGEAGIGKSRIAAAAADALQQNGWSTLRLSARTSLSALPLGGLAPLFASERPDLGRLASDPLALLTFASDRIRSLAPERHVLLVVDDLPLLDALSLHLVAQLVQTGIVRLLATIPEGSPVPDPILALWTESSALRIDIAPLDRDESARVLEAALGASVAGRTAETLHRASSGNPLFLRELSLGAILGGSLQAVEGVWQLVGPLSGTPALRDVMVARLQALTTAELDLIERLALCSRLPMAQLRQPNSRQTVRRLESAGLVSLSESNGVVVAALAQPHYASVVRSGMSLLRVEDVLLEQADIASEGELTTDEAFRVAVWRLDAGRPSNPDLLASSARLAQLTHDHAQAARLARAAIAAGAAGADIHILLADSLRRRGEEQPSALAVDEADRRNDAEPTAEPVAAQIAATRALLLHDQPGGLDAANSVLDEALARYPDQSESITLLRSMMLFTREESGSALDAIESLLTPGRVDTKSQPERAAVVALAAAPALAAAGRYSESEEWVAVLRDALPSTGDRAFVLFTTAITAFTGGSLDTARQRSLDTLSEAIQFDDEVSTRWAELLLGQVTLEIGAVDTASRWIRDAISGAQLTGPRVLLGASLATLAAAHAQAGRFDEADATLAGLSDDEQMGRYYRSLARGLVASGRGDADGAVGLLSRAASDYEEAGELHHASGLFFAAARIAGAGMTNPPAAAEHLAAALEAIAARGDSPLFAARASHARALVERDADELMRASAAWEVLGGDLFAAEAAAAAGAIARAAGEVQVSMGYLQRAQEFAARCAGAASAILEVSVAAPDVLTKRERQIADLAGSGLSSQEIASALFLSVRTVDNHLQSSYGKLGVAGRKELMKLLGSRS
ncbi:AAA ATPase domain-containing protein [Agreia bicolorata]|uniref:AAA ATPase domain-containing protein n=1 Tax=Agreia bicolorata TaxID=110935 RepID=A0A1T4YKW8_9MICO|nr:helix-turn-helix transcriptional regulator [Agreia bicolorata]SKB02406.1 AAA ATPase domain-containing protein [Agreia bicolorata]